MERPSHSKVCQVSHHWVPGRLKGEAETHHPFGRLKVIQSLCQGI